MVFAFILGNFAWCVTTDYSFSRAYVGNIEVGIYHIHGALQIYHFQFSSTSDLNSEGMKSRHRVSSTKIRFMQKLKKWLKRSKLNYQSKTPGSHTDAIEPISIWSIHNCSFLQKSSILVGKRSKSRTFMTTWICRPIDAGRHDPMTTEPKSNSR